ncbi:YHS domain-containing protein [Streptomyces spirodelae]|uniref:YHS domain-containing protein n=1 Tax=Streptomyces spirodelae TaxID=2812904 RepID=A0ABS3WSF6_9ACTN|nr:YHS domain-containing protein [Streptomyces spirodelae]MBO8185964.1 YHS domain-containing protein [Streptomyces spirodelae]
MLLIEVFTPKGTLSEEEQQALGKRLIDTLMVEDDSHAIEVIEAQRRITQVLVHEPTTWVLGERPAADATAPPRYLVRVTVPASWRKEMSEHTVRLVSEVLAETERAAGRDPERIRREPHAVVLVDGIPEGGVGLHGRAMSSLDLTELVSRPYRDRAAAPGADEPNSSEEQPNPPEGKLIDPVCGMSVDLEESTLTLVHQGALYAFCHGLCRRAFADEHGLSLSRQGGNE